MINNHKSLDHIHSILIDMDGVLWRGDKPMPGVKGFFDLMRSHRIGFVLVTNNASKAGEHYVERLASYGIDISPEEVLTSAQATAGYLAEQSEPDTPVYVIGEAGLRRALVERGFRLVDADETPKYVVVGWDRHLTYEKLAQATIHIYAGASFVGTNPDRTWPGERGLLPGAGAILAALQAATYVDPTVVGKPSPLMLQIAMRRIGAESGTTAMLGDRLDTDILGGRNAGLTTILVLSGITTRDDLAHASCQPDLIFDDIADLSRGLKSRKADAS